MNITFASTVIITKDFENMKSFYNDTLLQEIENDFGNCIMFKGGVSLWQLTDDYPIAKHLGRTYHKDGNKNIEICFETEDFEAVLSKLETVDIDYLHQVEEEVWGQRTIHIFDPEKNLVEIGESIPCFVKRMYDEGMSLAEVAERSSVPVEYVREICSV